MLLNYQLSQKFKLLRYDKFNHLTTYFKHPPHVWALFGLQWVIPHGVSDLFSSWQGSFGGHWSIDLWRAVPYCVLWCIWRERNSRCFKGKEGSSSDLKSLLLHTLLEWSSSFNLFPCSNFLEMLDLCNLCV